MTALSLGFCLYAGALALLGVLLEIALIRSLDAPCGPKALVRGGRRG